MVSEIAKETKVQHRILGKSWPRVDGLEKVTGTATYGVDMKLPGMLYGKVLRSPYPHAKIVKVDTSKARALPGIKAVLTADDIPQGKFGLAIRDQTVLACEKVRFVGEPLVAVAATDEELAEEALALISVEYQELPAVDDPEEGMKSGALLIHEDMHRYQCHPVYHPLPGTNICNYFRLRKGDLPAGFKRADFVFENSFRTQMVHHCYTEPHAAVASIAPSGKVTVWTNTQAPYRVRAALSEALGVPSSKIRVIATKVGGGFGGKISASIEPVCAVLSQKTNKPVKIILDRTEEFTATFVRHPATIKIKTGVKKDGAISAMEIMIIWDTGAYADHGLPVSLHSYGAAGPYNVPNVKLDSYCVYTNKIIAGAFRGFGTAQTCWAVESQLDIIARQLGRDPLEIRLNNGVEEGSVSPTGEILHSVGLKECLRKTAGLLGWTSRKKGPNQGWGIACAHKSTAPFTASCAYVKVNEDGSVGVSTSAVDIGQGSNTVLAQIAAEELGVSLEDVVLAGPDTDATPFDEGVLSSRISFHTGNAVKRAAADAKKQLLCLAADKLESRLEDLELRDRRIYVRGSPERGSSLAELSAWSHTFRGGPILGRGSFLTEDLTPLHPKTGQGAKPTEFWKYAAQAVEVEVDTETGQVDLVKVCAAADVGCAINPMSVEGQIEGGAVMGLGAALLEEVVLERGKVVNPSFMDYNVPTALDVPSMVSIIVEVPHKDGPFGAKGVGEGGTPPTAPAIANAIYNAVGVRVYELPLTPEKVFRALKEKEKGGG